MSKITYEGTHDAVDIPDLGIVATRGEPVEVEDSIAKTLLKGDDWTSDAKKQAEKDKADKKTEADKKTDNAPKKADTKENK